MEAILLRKRDPVLKTINSAIVDLPAPSNIRAIWNMGSLLGLILMAQLMTGLVLASQYANSAGVRFGRVVHMLQDVGGG